MNRVIEYLNELFPNAKCELNYSKDYELVIAVMLSAQTTDQRVNQVTSVLFKKYPNIDTLKDATIEDIETIIKPIGTYHFNKAFGIADDIGCAIPYTKVNDYTYWSGDVENIEELDPELYHRLKSEGVTFMAAMMMYGTYNPSGVVGVVYTTTDHPSDENIQRTLMRYINMLSPLFNNE